MRTSAGIPQPCPKQPAIKWEAQAAEIRTMEAWAGGNSSNGTLEKSKWHPMNQWRWEHVIRWNHINNHIGIEFAGPNSRERTQPICVVTRATTSCRTYRSTNCFFPNRAFYPIPFRTLSWYVSGASGNFESFSQRHKQYMMNIAQFRLMFSRQLPLIAGKPMVGKLEVAPNGSPLGKI